MIPDNKQATDSLILLISNLTRKIFNPEEMIKKFQIPPSHIRAIFILKRDGPMNISSLAKELAVSKPNMTPIIDKLIAEGHVRRYNDTHDRRIIKVELTEKADNIFEHRDDYLREIISNKIASLSEADTSELVDLAGRMLSIVNKLV